MATASSEDRKKRLVSALPYPMFEKLSMFLNPDLSMKDWRSLADSLGYTVQRIRNWGREKNPTTELLFEWMNTSKKNTVSLLIDHLLKLGRDDAVDLLRPYEYQECNQEMNYEIAAESDSTPQSNKTITQEIKNTVKRPRLENVDSDSGVSASFSNSQLPLRETRILEKTAGQFSNEHSRRRLLLDLAKCKFTGDRQQLIKSFHPGTREWLLDRVDLWFTKEPDFRVMVLTAGPGVGKSVIAAKVCEVYERKRQLAGCHFCKFNFADYRNPLKMVESLASHLCENIPGFQEKLLEQLERPHSRDTVPDAFRVLLHDPLYELGERQTMLIVIDALDESESGGKSELLKVISEEFPKLPKWIKVFITSRPELPVQKSLSHLKAVEILPDDQDNEEDVRCFLRNGLSSLTPSEEIVQKLVAKCQGSFLFAFHNLTALQKHSKITGRIDLDIIPGSISAVYTNYFDRMKAEIVKVAPNIDFYRILEIVAAAQGPLPLTFIGEALGLSESSLSGKSRPEIVLKSIIQKVNESISALLLVYDDSLTVFHKTVVDWLISDKYEDHIYKVVSYRGDEHLWQVCRKELEVLERTNPRMKMNKKEKYACKFGVNHGAYRSYYISYLRSQKELRRRSVYPPIGVFRITNLNNSGEERDVGAFGYLQPNRTFLVTTNEVVIEAEYYPILSLRFNSSITSRYVLKEKDYQLVCCSDKDSELDYAVIKLNTRLRSYDALKPNHSISCRCPSVGSIVGIHHGNHTLDILTNVVVPCPEGLINWLKCRSMPCSRDDIPQLTLDSVGGFDWDILERRKDSLLFHYATTGASAGCGVPVFSTLREVVALGVFNIFYKTREMLRKAPLISFSYRMDKIVDDIRRQDPQLADDIQWIFFETKPGPVAKDEGAV